MFYRVRALLAPPTFKDKEQNRIVGLTYLVTLSLLSAAILITVSSLFFGWMRVHQALTIGMIGALCALWLARRGHLRAASSLVLLVYLGILNYLLYVADGIHDIATVAYPLLLFVAGLLLDKRTFVVYALLTIFSIQAIAHGELSGFVVNRFSEFTSYFDLVVLSIILLITAISARRLSDDISESEYALRRHTHSLAQLNQLGQNLTVTHNLQQIAEQLSRTATDIVGTESVSVWLLNPEQEGELICWASSDHLRRERSRSPVDLRIQYGQGISGWVVESGESVIVPDVSSDARFFPGIDQQIGFQTHSLLAVPLRTHGTIIGVLEMLNKLAGEFTVDDVNLAETLAASAAIAIENAHLVEELRQQAADLEAQNAELDAFAHTAAHDLKGPLAPIVGYAHVLEEYYLTLPEEDVRSQLRFIAEGGTKMGNIINELLLLASVREVQEVGIHTLDMAHLVAEAQKRLAHMIEEHQAEIIVPSAGSWPLAQGYGPWIEEVWTNYLSNAIKYGGEPSRIEVGFDEPANQRSDESRLTGSPADSGQPTVAVRFWVHDSGPGLTPEEQARLFTPFERLYQVRAKGYGLGLSIVRRIVERLDGQVGVESQVGQGSRFWFTLPAYKVPVDALEER